MSTAKTPATESLYSRIRGILESARSSVARSVNTYEIEAIKSSWSARELERQINSLLYERLALSKDKKGLLKLAKKGHEVQTPADVFKDPVVLEFLGLPESPRPTSCMRPARRN